MLVKGVEVANELVQVVKIEEDDAMDEEEDGGAT